MGKLTRFQINTLIALVRREIEDVASGSSVTEDDASKIKLLADLKDIELTLRFILE